MLTFSTCLRDIAWTAGCASLGVLQTVTTGLLHGSTILYRAINIVMCSSPLCSCCCCHHLVPKEELYCKPEGCTHVRSMEIAPDSRQHGQLLFAGGDTPDALTDPGEATDMGTSSQGAADSRSPDGEKARKTQTAADQLDTAESLGSGQAQAPNMRMSNQPKAAHCLVADQPRALESVTTGEAEAPDMLSAAHPKPANSLAADQLKAADSPTAGQAQATQMPVAGSSAPEQTEDSLPPVVLILCGVPGSGKSTFCAQLIAQGQASWVRVNQDSINNGRKVLVSVHRVQY